MDVSARASSGKKDDRQARQNDCTDDEIVKHLYEWIHHADTDELSRIVGECFGGECFYENEDTGYIFTPNSNYYGEFDKLQKSKTK